MSITRHKFKVGDIVHYLNVYGTVKSTEFGITVRFPDPHDSACFKEVNFHPNGSLTGFGDQPLLQKSFELFDINEYCRAKTRSHL